MFRRIVVSLCIRSSKMSENFRLDRNNNGFQNMFYTKCINVIIDSIGPSNYYEELYVHIHIQAFPSSVKRVH